MTDLDPTTTAPIPDPNVLGSQVETHEVAPRGGRYRWPIALGIVAVVIVASVLVLSQLTGRAPSAAVLGYVPDDSIMYGTVRLDLPGDQRANLGGFLSKFPGFADQSTLETKIDEVLDRLIGMASEGSRSFSTDIKPWFGGELAFSVGALPDPSVLSGGDEAAIQSARFLLLVSVKDESVARAWFESALAEAGANTSTETHGGTTLTLFSAADEQPGAYALLGGKVVVVGDVASVKAAIDTNGSSGFAAQAEPKAALESTTGDHIGFVYVALRPVLEWSSKLSESEIGGGGLPGEALLGLVPDWAAFALRAEGDAMVMETVTPRSEAAPGASGNRLSALAEHIPSSAVALAISHDYGKGILDTLATYRSEPSLKPTIDAIDQAIGILGGTEAAIGWIGDLGITVTRADDALEGGLVIVPTDRAAADRLFTSLRAVVSLGGVALGVSVRDEAYAGSTITIVDLGELDNLVGQAGIPPEVLGSGGLPTGRAELAYAITDQVVVIGSGPGFVRHVLDTTAATSIASNDRYKALAGRVGQGTGIAFADLSAIRELIEAGLADSDPADRAEYEREYKPFLSPFDALVGSNSVDGEVTRSTIIVTVK